MKSIFLYTRSPFVSEKGPSQVLRFRRGNNYNQYCRPTVVQNWCFIKSLISFELNSWNILQFIFLLDGKTLVHGLQVITPFLCSIYNVKQILLTKFVHWTGNSWCKERESVLYTTVSKTKNCVEKRSDGRVF